MMNKHHTSPDIVVVGSINMDVVVRTKTLPQPGETVTGHALMTQPGGKGANQAVAAARQGAHVALIASLGEDTYGQTLLTQLHTDHIDTTHVHTHPTTPTGVATVMVDDMGQNSIIVIPGANAHLSREHIQNAQASIAEAKLLICQCEVPLLPNITAIAVACAHNVPVLFNSAPAIALPPSFFSHLTYWVLNETEAAYYVGHPVTLEYIDQTLHTLIQYGPAYIFLTLGEAGVYVMEKKTKTGYHLPAVPVHAVDTTAAGDAFIGGFAATLVRETNLYHDNNHVQNAVSAAQYCAALTVTQLGAQASLPTQKAVAQFRAEHAPHK